MTPHPATQMAPGDILFRCDYQSDFPSTQRKLDGQMDAARNNDLQQKKARKEKTNDSVRRKAMNVNLGDKVLIRDMARRSKFDPMYFPEVFHVIELVEKGVIVMGRNGSIKRRHKDDIKMNYQRSNVRVEDNGEQVDTGAGVDTGVEDGEIGDREKIQIGSEHSLWGIELDGTDGGHRKKMKWRKMLVSWRKIVLM